ncbi:MAG: cytochrome c family protein [Alphaproteobacteria bacterium]
MSLESNKIFAAVLVAGITAMLGGFVAEVMIHPHALEADAVAIEGAPEEGAAAGPVGPEPILHLIATADIAKGEKLSKACAACHSFQKGEPSKLGPNLWNTVGASKGSHQFEYSDGMKAKGGTWTYSDLNHFLFKPKAFITGTKMNFIGLKKAEDRAAMVAWLRTLADSPQGLPGQGEIDAEAAELAPPAADAAAAPAEGAAPAEALPVEAPVAAPAH